MMNEADLVYQIVYLDYSLKFVVRAQSGNRISNKAPSNCIYILRVNVRVKEE